jgi:hypothetical protein
MLSGYELVTVKTIGIIEKLHHEIGRVEKPRRKQVTGPKKR